MSEPNEIVETVCERITENDIKIEELTQIISEIEDPNDLGSICMVAIQNNRLDIIKYIIPDKLNDVDYVDVTECIPACSLEILEYFIDVFEIEDFEDLLVSAVTNNEFEIYKFLMEKSDYQSVYPNDLLHIAELNDIRIIKDLVGNGGDIHDNSDGLLHSAIHRNDVEVIFYIIEHALKRKEKIICGNLIEENQVNYWIDEYKKSIEEPDEE